MLSFCQELEVFVVLSVREPIAESLHEWSLCSDNLR